ncbi:MAG: PDZ domain-containing protein, partial [Planctomycetota bacterium JB042]
HLDGAPVEEVSAFESALEAAANAVVGRRVVRVDRRGTRLDLPLDVPPAGGARDGARPRRRSEESGASASVRAFGATGRSGVGLTEVEGGGVAARFGLRSGDVVVAVDGAPVAGADALRRRIEGGRPRALTDVRDGTEIEVLLRGRAAGDGASAAAGAARPWIGVELTPTPSGLEVSAVRPDSPAARAGLRVGDRLVALGDRPVSSGDALAAAIGRHRPGDRIEVSIERDGARLGLPVVLGRRDG